MSRRADILLVDDDADQRDTLAGVLRSEGHIVIEAADGQLALDALAARPPFGVIVLDLMMPVMDGPTFLEHKSRGLHTAVPVVIFSSSPFDELEGLAGNTTAVHKADGIDGLLAAIDCATGGLG
ncbi:MAG: response regulator [Myxococcales bacterium]